MRTFLAFLVLAFAVALAADIGVRMRWDWPAFSLGLVCGAVASVPASLLALCLAWRADDPAPAQQAGRGPLLFMDLSMPVRGPQLPDFAIPTDQSGNIPAQRRFRVVGEE